MKTLHFAIIIIFVIAACGTGIAHGELVPKTLANLYQEYQGKLIVLGQIMSVSENTAKNLTSYDIKILDYVTRPQQASIITASSHTQNKTIPVFGVGDTVQLYLDRGLSGYEISQYSFKMDKKCSTWFGPSHLDFESLHGGPASDTRFLDIDGNAVNPSLGHELVLATDGVYTPLDSIGFEVYVSLNNDPNPIFHDTKQFNVQPCTYATPTWKYTPTEYGNYTIFYKVIGGVYQDKIILPNASMTTGFTIEKSKVVQSPKNTTNFIGNDLIPIISSPLKQFKSGIAANNVICRPDLQLLIETHEGLPICVKPNSAFKLLYRDWSYPVNCKYNQDVFTAGVEGIIIIEKNASNPSSDKSYSPRNSIVIIGWNNTVSWINQDVTTSSVTSDWNLFDSGLILPGNNWQYNFECAGNYGYHSEPHPWMRGWIRVLPPTK